MGGSELENLFISCGYIIMTFPWDNIVNDALTLSEFKKSAKITSMTKSCITTFLFAGLISCSFQTKAQCPAGKVEVAIDVLTDAYGYEFYWQLLPAGNNCGLGTIFSGGNTTVGCNGGGDQDQTPGGYGNFQTISTGPWCLDEGANFDVFMVDDWGDGGTALNIIISGYPVHRAQSITTDERFTFKAVTPPALEVKLLSINTPSHAAFGDINIKGELQNRGTSSITSFDLSYSIDNGQPVAENFSGLNIAPFENYLFILSDAWMPPAEGTYNLEVSISNVNGEVSDADTTDNRLSMIVTVMPPIPDIMSSYAFTSNTFSYQTIGTTSDQLSTPRDLDFQQTGELWVVNKETEASGGTTVTFFNPGKPNQSSEHLKDQNSWHFMSLPTGIAFSNNGNFATSPGVLDANHSVNPVNPFTGPTLWSGDLQVYAQPSGGNGSHLDMLHESPFAMGIASAGENKFWVFDSYNKDIVFYDFKEDHGPGNDDHSDGVIRRYKGQQVERINDHIVCHLDYDVNTGWLYIVDGGNQRILRLNTETGTIGGTPSYGPMETLAEYVNVTGATWETVVSTGLTEPAGIDVFGDYMLVSDHANGDIIVYDISSMPATELNRINTGSAGIMGIVIGPDGRIWYVNASQNILNRIEPDSLLQDTTIVDTTDTTTTFIMDIHNEFALNILPNPADDQVTILLGKADDKNQLAVFNSLGEMILEKKIAQNKINFSVANWTPGIYVAKVKNGSNSYSRKFMVH